MDDGVYVVIVVMLICVTVYNIVVKCCEADAK